MGSGIGKLTTAYGFWRRGDQWTEVLSSEPRVSICHNFLSKEECEHLINLARPHMKRSFVTDRENLGGPGKISSRRTSTGMFLTKGVTGQSNKFVRDIKKRIADYTSMPIENGGNLQVLHYEVGQKVDIHRDYFSEEEKIMCGIQRALTIIIYLSDVEEGGETVLPMAKSANYIISSNVQSTDKGIFVQPKMGDALLFWNIKPDGSVDPLTWHGSVPVIKGNKWACTQWLHDGPCQRVATSSSPLNEASIPGAKSSLSSKRPHDDSQDQRDDKTSLTDDGSTTNLSLVKYWWPPLAFLATTVLKRRRTVL